MPWLPSIGFSKPIIVQDDLRLEHDARHSSVQLYFKNIMVARHIGTFEAYKWNVTKLKRSRIYRGPNAKDTVIQKNKSIVLMAYIFQLTLLFPFYILGLITNYIPYKIPAWIFKALKPDIEYRASIYMITGMIVFPLFYLINIFLFRMYISNNLVWSIVFLLSLPFLGFIVLFYWKIMMRFIRVLKFYFIVKKKEREKLIVLRDSLTNQINNI